MFVLIIPVTRGALETGRGKGGWWWGVGRGEEERVRGTDSEGGEGEEGEEGEEELDRGQPG